MQARESLGIQHLGLLILPKATLSPTESHGTQLPSTVSSNFGQKSSKKGSQALGRGYKNHSFPSIHHSPELSQAGFRLTAKVEIVSIYKY